MTAPREVLVVGGTGMLQEISDAALRGLRDSEPEQIAGRVEPWSDRP